MKVSELVSKTYDNVVIYKADEDCYVDVFAGQKKDIPKQMLQMEVKVFGCKRKDVLDIQINI